MFELTSKYAKAQKQRLLARDIIINHKTSEEQLHIKVKPTSSLVSAVTHGKRIGANRIHMNPMVLHQIKGLITTTRELSVSEKLKCDTHVRETPKACRRNARSVREGRETNKSELTQHHQHDKLHNFINATNTHCTQINIEHVFCCQR